MRLSGDLFRAVVENTPLISIDLVVRNGDGEVLLGKRLNQPAQGFWFVPGGRIYKDESIDQAFLRLTREELGKETAKECARFLGYFEHFYPDNFSGDDFSTHYVVLAFELELDVSLEQLPSVQHNDYRWFLLDELLASEEVHLHTKSYF